MKINTLNKYLKRVNIYKHNSKIGKNIRNKGDFPKKETPKETSLKAHQKLITTHKLTRPIITHPPYTLVLSSLAQTNCHSKSIRNSGGKKKCQ